MKKIKSFIINRKTWLRGEGSQNSYLFREKDGKQCCIGTFLLKCGFSECDLLDIQDPSNIKGKETKVPKWLIDFSLSNYTFNTGAANDLIAINDRKNTKEEEREKEIKERFAEQGIKVKFTGK